MSLRNVILDILNRDLCRMNEHTVTVLMTVYNGQRYLRQAIESILAQTFEDFELLIINDGSTDSSRRIALEFNDRRIRLVDNENNMGLARSLNKGLRLCEGKFIARHDADDFSEPSRLAKQVAFLENNKQVALLGTWYSDMDADGNIVRANQLPCGYTDIRWSLLFFCPFVHSSVMFRKCVVPGTVGFYSEALVYSTDYELWCRVASRTPVANLDEYLVRLRTHPWSMTSTYGDRTLEGHRIRITKMGELLGWDNTKFAENAAHFARMTSLLFNDQDLTPQQENEMSVLHDAFCRFYDIEEADCKSHWATFRGQLRSRIKE